MGMPSLTYHTLIGVTDMVEYGAEICVVDYHLYYRLDVNGDGTHSMQETTLQGCTEEFNVLQD